MFEHNHIPELVQEILRGKALSVIVESATVKDASGNVIELKNLRPDGTIGEPEAEAAATGPPDAAADEAGTEAVAAAAAGANEAPTDPDSATPPPTPQPT